MSDHPTDRHARYYEAVQDADDALEEAVTHVRARQDAGEITTLQAANERIRLLENHQAEVRRLRIEHLGGTE